MSSFDHVNFATNEKNIPKKIMSIQTIMLHL